MAPPPHIISVLLAKPPFAEKETLKILGILVVFSTEPPVGKVTYKVVDDSLEEIQATWTRDGEPCVYETLRRNVAPNSDGTYYISLSIEIDPKERDHFQCYLDHDGLWRPLVLAFKEET
ncbi:hypothetical protein E2320_014292, partial [Naja naja]